MQMNMGGMFSAVGALIQGRQQRGEIDAQRKVLHANIGNAEYNLRQTGLQASAEEEMARRESRQLLGSQRAAIAQSGVGYDGSSTDIMRQSATNSELDALNIRYAGTLERYSILNDVAGMKYEDKLLKRTGKQVMRMRWFNAASAFFGGSQVNPQNTSAGTYASSKTGANYRATPTIGGLSKSANTWAATKTGTYGGFGNKKGG